MVQWATIRTSHLNAFVKSRVICKCVVMVGVSADRRLGMNFDISLYIQSFFISIMMLRGPSLFFQFLTSIRTPYFWFLLSIMMFFKMFFLNKILARVQICTNLTSRRVWMCQKNPIALTIVVGLGQ